MADTKTALPSLPEELYEHYPEMSAQTHEAHVQKYARTVLASERAAQRDSQPAEQVSTAEDYLRGRYGAYRGHFAWRELEEAFNAGKTSARQPVADTVLKPRNSDQAAAMALLGTRWLRDNDPDRLNGLPMCLPVRSDTSADARDAARYRWARTCENGNALYRIVSGGECAGNMDAAIDAAIAASRETK